MDQLLKKAEQLAQKKKWKKAAEAFSRIEELGQVPLSVFGPSFANVLKENGDEDRAVEIYLKLAMEATEANKLQKAVVFFNKALEKNPQLQKALFSLSHVHRSLGNFIEAHEIEQKLRQVYQSRGLLYKALELLEKEISSGELSRSQWMAFLDKKCELLKKTGQWVEWTDTLFDFFLKTTAFSLNPELNDEQAAELFWLRKKISDENPIVKENPKILSIQCRLAFIENKLHKSWSLGLRSVDKCAFSFSSLETLAALYLRSNHIKEAKEIVSFLNRWIQQEDLAEPLLKKDLDWLEDQGLKQVTEPGQQMGLYQMNWLEEVPQSSSKESLEERADFQVRDDAMTWFTNKIPIGQEEHEEDSSRDESVSKADTGNFKISFGIHQEDQTDEFDIPITQDTEEVESLQPDESHSEIEEPKEEVQSQNLGEQDDSQSIPDLAVTNTGIVGIEHQENQSISSVEDPQKIREALLKDFGLSQYEESVTELNEKESFLVEAFFHRALEATYLEKIDYGIALFQLGLFEKSFQLFDSLNDEGNAKAHLTKIYLKAKALSAQGMNEHALSELQGVIDSYDLTDHEKKPFIELRERFRKRSVT